MDFEKRLQEMTGADFTYALSVGDWQGTTYYLLRKDGKYSVSQLTYGSCSHCDWVMQIEESHGGYGPYPDSIYEPVIQHLLDQVCWRTKDEFFANSHMIFGIGSEDKEALERFSEIIKGQQ